MSVSTFQLASPDISLPGERSLPRTLAAIAFLVALGILMIGSLLSAGDEWSLAQARNRAAPASLSGPNDPHC